MSDQDDRVRLDTQVLVWTIELQKQEVALGGVALRGLSKVFPNGVEAVKDVDLSALDGELLAIVGPSGSGKSTLLRLIAGLETPTAGSIAIGGHDVTARSPRERDLAMVFQEPALFPYLSVTENLAFGLRARGIGRAETTERVKVVAEMLGLTALLDRRPETLSGGQRQRVALGGAVARRPSVFLLDEPLSRLDAPLRASLGREVGQLHRRLGATMIFVTHDQAEALALGDRVAVMDGGRVVQVGRPIDVYQQPASTTVAAFIGSPPMRLYEGRIVARGVGDSVGLEGIDGELLMLPEGRGLDAIAARRGRGVLLGLRPEHVMLAVENGGENPGLTWLSQPAEVVRVDFQGHESTVVLVAGNREFDARVSAGSGVRPADRLALGMDFRRASWFDPETGQAIPLNRS